MTDRVEAELERLRALRSPQQAEHILDDLRRRARAKQRQVAGAVVGAGLSAVAAIAFVLRGDALGYFALPVIVAVFVYVAVRASKGASSLSELTSGRALLDSWHEEVTTQLRQIGQAQFIALLFGGLTTWVMIRHGVTSGRGLFYGAAAVLIAAYSVYQWLVVRPTLQRELAALESND